MLNINIKKSELPLMEERKHISSKKVNIDVNLEAIVQIAFQDRNIVDIIEKLIIDLLLTKIDKFWDVYDSFSLILEKLNKELKVLSKDYNLDTINIFIWVVQWDVLHFSILWSYSIYLIKNNKIIDIADWMQWKNLEFSYISSWNVNINDTIFLANLNLLDYVTRDDIFEITRTEKIDKLEIIEQILSQEAVSEQYNLISIVNATEVKDEGKNIALDLIKSKFLSIKDKLIENKQVDNLLTKIKNKIDLKNKYVYLTLLSVWVICAVTFLYLIIWSILNSQMKSSIPEQYKNKLIEAKMILERTNKDIWNKEVFDSNIKKAENLIFEVRWKKLFMNDVKKLLDYISILKKQANWIETFTLTADKAQILFTNKDFWLVWIYEVWKKYFYVWKNSVVWPFIKWENPKTYTYPDWEEVISADVTPEWNVFLLTKSNRVLEFTKQDFKYVNVEWQRTWENTIWIKSFNWNLYTLSTTKNQIYKHKPGVSWFSAKSALLDEKISKWLVISDFAIDWGFYLLKQDLTLDKFFTTPTFEKKSIVINNTKNSSYTNNSNITPKLLIWQNLNYIYMLMDNKIWIFEPDNRNYRDVKSIKYVWQLESSEWKINSIFVPKDWSIIVWNENWAYEIHFEISDNKVIIR